MRRFQALGLTDVTIDQEGNVIARRPGTGNGPTLVLGAHLDTVFPAGTDVRVREENGIYHAPGISDDARGLAVILQVLRTMQEKNIQTVGDICFVCTVGEEGNGDLRGSKHLFLKSGMKIDGFISVDGVDVGRLLCCRYWLQALPRAFRRPGRPFHEELRLPLGDSRYGPRHRQDCRRASLRRAENNVYLRYDWRRHDRQLHCGRTARWNSTCAVPAVRSIEEIEAQILPQSKRLARRKARWGAEGDLP